MNNIYQPILKALQEDQYGFDPHSGSSFSWRERLSETVKKLSLNLNQSQMQRIESEFFGLGPLEDLIDDREITEIIVNRYDSIWFEKAGSLFQHQNIYCSELTLKNAIERICQESGLIIDLNIPYTDGRWRDLRMHLVSPPISPNWQMTLRRLSSFASRDSEQMPVYFDGPLFNYARKLVEQKSNLLIVGPTSSGKTTLLNQLLSFVSLNERTICIEDSSELIPPNSVSTKLLTRFDSRRLLEPVSLAELVRQSLRMRPDRIALGEVRGPEAKDLLLALATGHCGSFGTLHARSAREALLRLEMLVQLGAPQWSIHSIRTLILLSLNAIVVVEKNINGQRRIKEIHHIVGCEEHGLLLEQAEAP